MPKIEWYDWKAGRRLPIHSEFNPVEQAVYIRRDDPDIDPHVSMGHELAHVKLDVDSTFGGEIEAWEETIYNLMRADEWDNEVKEQIVWALTGDSVGNFEDEARWWVNRAEKRAEARLSRG